MPKIRWLATILLGLYAFASCNPEVPKFAFNTAERRGTLANGLRFVVMPDLTTKLVEVDVRYDVGSREDPIGKSGLAHLVEHLMFQARPDGPTSPPLFKAIMDRSTFFNAYTNWDTTHYMTQSQAFNLDAMLKIESMRMYYAADVLSDDHAGRVRTRARGRAQRDPRAIERGGLRVPQLDRWLRCIRRGTRTSAMIGGNDAQIAER